MNPEYSKRSDLHRLLLNPIGEIGSRRQHIAKIYCFIKTQHLLCMDKYIAKSEKINKFKISAPTLNEKFKLSDRSYSILDIQDNFEHILKNHGKKQLILQ